MPGGRGDYAADLAHLREWQPALLISLTTRIELIETGSERLGQDMQERGARWVHLPIADFGIPDRETDAPGREVSAMA